MVELKKVDGKDLTEKQITTYLDLLENKELASHYKFHEEVECVVSNEQEAVNFLTSNKPITMSFKDDVLYYKLEGESEQEEVFSIDISTSFSESDKWLCDKITPVAMIFPNAASATVSAEMTSFYICLVIASTFKKEFEEEFKDICKTYDFSSWRQQDKTALDFTTLSGEWIQLGSKTIKMIAAACKYAIVRERSKKEVRTLLGLPEATDLRLNDLLKSISDIRYHYDNIVLSAEEKAKLSRLEIKNIIAKRDAKIEAKLREDNGMYQLWRLMNLNSNNLLPNEVRGFILNARKQAPEMFLEITGREPDIEDPEDLMSLKKIQDKLKKEAIRASLNKLFTEEVNKYKEDPEAYIAPNFM